MDNGPKAKTVEDCFPREAFQDWPALAKLRQTVVVAEHSLRDADWVRWPGKQKNVMYWIEIEGEKAVGWNENDASGWSFPVISYRSKLKKDCGG